MSSRFPIERRKQIFVRKNYYDEKANSFDNNIIRPIILVKKFPENHQKNIIITNKYISDSNEGDIIIALDEKSEKPTLVFEELSKRIESLENMIQKNLQGNDSLTQLKSKIEKIEKEQTKIKDKFESISHAGSEGIDELLSVVNDTRRDLEEKISNIKQLNDGNWLDLDNKMDDFHKQQDRIQMQITEIMNILTELSSSRATSVNEKHILSRSSSKASILKQHLSELPPTVNFSRKNSISRSSYASQKNQPPKKKIDPVQTPQLNNSIEKLYKQVSIETIPFVIESSMKQREIPSNESSSGSLIEPLVINERRSSQPANLFLNQPKN